MPKKFAGENSKAVLARQRKEDAKHEKVQKEKQKNEDLAWQDDDKKLAKKQQKKEEEERKRQQQLEKKAEAKALLQKEVESIKPSSKVAPPSVKVTRAQIQQEKEKATATVNNKHPKVILEEPPLEENLNRVQLDGEVAQSVDEAITILSDTSIETDKHPEKRMKSAYAAFEEMTLPILKADNPTFRLSQIKQLLRKEWLKSPNNPLNQKY